MHPCMTCGACCAAYRVAFHWMETLDDGAGKGVPEALTEPLDSHRLVMTGTRSSPVRCVALDADIGRRARCRIYTRRPSVCRDVMAAGENGAPSDQCDRARIRHGLAPLTSADWQAHEQAMRAQVSDIPRKLPANDHAVDAPLGRPA